jgi:CelD/BcsL family acetyltransferase involved in cellulose biosynthesis
MNDAQSQAEASVIADDAALAAFAPEWQALWRRATDAPPFASPDWLLPWWRQFGTGAPCVGVLRAGGAPVAVLPFYRLDDTLLPLGAGITDYQDVLRAPEAPAQAASLLLAAILSRAGDDTACELLDVPPDAALRDVAAPPGWRAAWRAADPCPVLALDDARDAEAALPARAARKLRMNRNRATRLGGFSIETAEPETAPSMLDALIELHQARWIAAGETGVLADSRVCDFHREAATALIAAGAMRLCVLRLGGAIAAACMALLDRRARLMFYLSGYDAAHAQISPGSLLIAAMIDAAIAEGRTEVHFLRGGEGYKYALGGIDRTNAACRLARQ